MPSAHATHDHTKYRISVKPETATNTVGEEHCVTATVRDTGHGGPNSGHQPVVGVAVQFTVTGANSTSGTGVTNASGEATFCYIGTKAGTDNITAFADRDADKTLDAGEPSASVKKTWVPGPAAKIVLEPAAATNTTGQQHCVTATVTDAFGNPIANAAVVFSVTGANPRAATVKTTDASGKATFCYTGANAGQDVITAFVDTDKDNTKDLTEPVGTATKTYVAPTPAMTTVTLSPLTATNRAGEQHCVTATVTTTTGPVGAGVPVVFSVTGANPAGGTVTTDAAGKATFCYTGKNVGQDVITAYADADRSGSQNVLTEPTATALKTYVPGAPANVTVAPPAAENTVGTQHCVTATVTDAFGNPTPGVTVFFRVSGANAADGQATTGANGTAVFCYTGTNAGLDTITAVADADGDNQAEFGEPTGTATKLYHPGAPRTVTMNPPADENTVGDEHCVTATVHDEFGNPTPDVTVFFSVTGANPQARVARTTNESGQAEFCYTGTKAGQDVIRAVADADDDGQAEAGEPTGLATKTYKPGPPAKIELAPQTAENVAGEEHCVTATVTDEFGNPVPGAAVDFSVSGANTAAGARVTDAEGEAEFCYTGTKAGTDTITATVTGTNLTATATKKYKPGPPANVEVTPATAENEVGQQHCVTAVVTDRFGNRVGAGIAVFFNVTGANPTADSGTTNASGEATFCYTGTKAGLDTITATADANGNNAADVGEPTGVATKRYKPGPPAKVELAPETAENEAGEQHCVTATVTDRFGNPVAPGHPIVFEVTGANPRPKTVVATDANGQATFCYTGTKAGTDTIMAFADLNGNAARDAGEPSDTATKTYVPGPPEIVNMEPPAAENVAGEQHCVTATVTDRYGNPVGAGFEVIFRVTGANPRGPETRTTDANSEATFCYTGTKAGTDVITAVVDTNGNGQADVGEPTGTATKVYKPGPPAKLELAPKTATNTVGEEHCVTATVTDEFGNPTPGITVRFSVTGSVGEDGSLGASGADTTDRNGQAKFCYTSHLPGVNTITAYADTNDNGSQDDGEPTDAATKTYVPPGSTAECEITITEGAWIIGLNGDKGTAGGNAKIEGAGAMRGELEYQDHGPLQPLNYHATEVLAIVCSQDRKEATIFTQGRLDGVAGVPARIRVRDDAEPGRTDVYGILLPGYWSGDQNLEGGNIQVH